VLRPPCIPSIADPDGLVWTIQWALDPASELSKTLSLGDHSSAKALIVMSYVERLLSRSLIYPFSARSRRSILEH
jgi:hypothetical protein